MMPIDERRDHAAEMRARTRARIGSQFRRQREALDKTLKQVEGDLKDDGFSASMLSRIENGDTGLEHDQVLKLCSYYGVDPKHVYGLDDAPFAIYRSAVIKKHYEAALHETMQRVANRHKYLVSKGIYKYLEFDPELVLEKDDKAGSVPHQLMSVLMLQVNRANEEDIIISLRKDESVHESEEFWYVLEGEVEFFYAQPLTGTHTGPLDKSNIVKRTLQPGDSVYLSARGHHAVRAPGENPARVIVVIAEFPLLTKRQIEVSSGLAQ